jgi:hypothetical protein
MKSTVFLLVTALAVSVLAQGEPRGLPDSARKEIVRRGYMVQVVSDDISDDGMDRMAAAAGETPADDSDKFNLTVLYGKFKNEQLDKLKADLLNADAKNLGAWVECKNRAQGTYDVYSTDASHLHVRFEQVPNVADPDKWKGHDKFPTIVFQTPWSGKFGKPGLVIDFKVGYDGKPEALAEWLAVTLKKFSESPSSRATKEYLALKEKHLGHRAFYAGAHDDIGGGNIAAGYKAPFEATQKTLPVGENVPSPFPPSYAPNDPKPLTLDQLKAIVPDATPDFLLAQLTAKVSSADQVKLAWMMKQLQDAKKPVETPVVNPTPDKPVPKEEPVPVSHPILDWLVASGVLTLLLHIALSYFGVYPKAKVGPEVTRAVSQIAPAIGDSVAERFFQRIPMRPSPSAQPSPAPSMPPSPG